MSFFFVALCLLGVSARADQVVLKNGDRITGTIVKSDVKADDKTKTVLIIKTEFAGDVPVLWDAVASVVSAEPLHLQLKDGQTIVGTVTHADGREVRCGDDNDGEVATPKDAIVAVRNDAEQKTYDDTVDRLRHPRLTDFWSGLLDTGLSVTRGNSSTLSFTLAGKAVRQTDRDKISVYTTAVYASDDTTPPSRTTAHAIQGGLRGDLNVSRPRVSSSASPITSMTNSSTWICETRSAAAPAITSSKPKTRRSMCLAAATSTGIFFAESSGRADQRDPEDG